MKVVILNVVDV